MQWLLTAVVLGAACWMVSALTYEDEGAAAAPSRLLEVGRASIPRLGAAGRSALIRWSQVARSAIWRVLRTVGIAIGTAARAVGATVGRTQTAMRTRAAARQRARVERRRLTQTAQRYVPFEKSLILTGPQETTAAGMSLPAFSLSTKRPSALSRLLAAIQIVFLVVIWGSAAALAIAGAAWAVSQIV